MLMQVMEGAHDHPFMLGVPSCLALWGSPKQANPAQWAPSHNTLNRLRPLEFSKEHKLFSYQHSFHIHVLF
jgi:hypothetical protein